MATALAAAARAAAARAAAMVVEEKGLVRSYSDTE